MKAVNTGHMGLVGRQATLFLIAQLTAEEDGKLSPIGTIAKKQFTAKLGGTGTLGWQIWDKPVEVPDPVRLDLIYAVYNDDAISELVLKGFNYGIKVAVDASGVGKVPVIGDYVKERLAIDVDKFLTEEYGRATTQLSKKEAKDQRAFSFSMNLVSRNDICGRYLILSQGARLSDLTTFVRAGSTVAEADLTAVFT
ncbi:MAG TPA: hypothetical protein VMT19_02800 [Thermoanaerobaculaceae bacterium]|nr:hypothetical protein [Thermoanaerobaculaceae bacterium]